MCDIEPALLEIEMARVRESGILDRRYTKLRLEEYDLLPVCCDEELWPFRDDHLQLIVSNLNLGWVNDLGVAL